MLNIKIIFLGLYSQPHLSLSTVSDQQQQSEVSKQSPEKKEFQAETRMLLDIVARSLYSDKEVSLLYSY